MCGLRTDTEAAGINAEHPIMSERRQGDPGRWRSGDDLVVRRSDGGIVHYFGWFKPSQQQARKRWSDALARAARGSAPE